jgi:Transglutaminase-like superfamily
VPVNPQLYTARLPGGGAAIMDIRTWRGQWRHLNTTAAHLWHQLTDGVSEQQALDDLANDFSGQGADPELVRRDLVALADQLRALRLDVPAAPAPEPGRPVIHLALDVATVPPAADRAVAMVGLAAALALLSCAPIRFSIAVGRVLARLPHRSATPEEADLLFAAVRRVGRWWPGRVACLEESLACYLAAALRGRGVCWVIGARTAPAGAHAWTEVDGQVIGQDPADRIWPYAPALRIPE